MAAIPHIGQTTVNCPADPGGRGWPATAYSPKTGMLYMPLNEYCANTTPTPLDPGQAYTGGGRATGAAVPVPNSDGKIGRVDAVKLADQSTAWSYRTRAPATSAVLPTGSRLCLRRERLVLGRCREQPRERKTPYRDARRKARASRRRPAKVRGGPTVRATQTLSSVALPVHSRHQTLQFGMPLNY